MVVEQDSGVYAIKMTKNLVSMQYKCKTCNFTYNICRKKYILNLSIKLCSVETIKIISMN